MGSDWCRKRSGRICIKYPPQCCYGRLCNKTHTKSFRVICTKVRYMLAGVKDREGNLITCDENCPWVPYGGHWPAFGEPNEVFDEPTTESEEIVALRLVDSPFNLNSAAMGFVCGFWTPNGHCRRDGSRINWVSGDPDCLYSAVLCGTGRTSGRY